MTEIEMSSIYINFRVKILCAAWHPTEENIVAFGSDEGRVGVVDISKKKVLYSYETHHNYSVYSLQWAPCKKLEDSEEKFYLYSVGGGQIYVYELNKPKEKPVDFETLITLPSDLENSLKGCSELSWKSDYSCLAIGSTKGFVELFDGKLNFLARLTLQMKNIENLRWHPLCTYTSPNGSSYSCWLAAAGNDDSIHIFDTTEVINGQSESVLCKSTRTLIGHKKRVASVCWSPHIDAYLVSASRDGTAQVWNVIAGNCIAIYPCHRDFVYAVQWNLFDPDIIYSGGMDNCLRIWKISEQSKVLSTEKFKIVKHKSYKPKDKNSTVKESKLKDINSPQKESFGPETSDNIIPEDSENIAEGPVTSTFAKRNYKENWKVKVESSFSSKHLKNLFPFTDAKLSSKEESLEDIIKLTDFHCDQHESDFESPSLKFEKNTAEELMKISFFADQNTALKMLETRANSESANGNMERATFLHVMSCNVKPLLISAAEKKQLTDLLVSSAPSVSYKFWLEMCEKYAEQLVEEEQYMKAGMYYLFCRKWYEAIKLYLEKGKILEALALARSCLPDSDPFLTSVYSKAAHEFATKNLILNEASCYLAMKEPLQAAKVLFCTANSKNIYISTYICSKFNFLEEAKTYGYFCMEKCLSQNDWPTFYKVVQLVDSIKVYKVLVRVHEVFTMCIKELKRDDESKLFGVTGNKLKIWEGKTFKNSSLTFLSHIYEILKNEGILPEDKLHLEEIHKALDSMVIKRKKYEVPAEAHVSVAIYITQIIITSLLGDLNLADKYFIKIFSIVQNIAFLPRITCQLFLPLDLYWCSYEDTIICENKIKETEIFPFSSHFQSMHMSFYNKFTSIDKSDLKNNIIQCISSDMDAIFQKVTSTMSKKTREDSILLYFCSFYLNELRRQAKKGWKFKCYDNAIEIRLENEINKNDVVNSEQNTSSEDSNSKQGVQYQNNLIENKIVYDYENDSVIHVANNDKQIVSAIDYISKQKVKSNNSISEPTLLNINDSEVTKHETTLSENIEEVKLSALGMIDKMLSDGNVPVFENIAISAKKIMEPVQNPQCQNMVEEKSIETVSNVFTNEITALKNNTETQLLALKNSDKISEINVSILQNDVYNTKQCIVDKESNVCDENNHLQCWADISLYYVVLKFFISIMCKDEYALQYYLEKCLHQVDSDLANIARQNSSKPLIKLNKNNKSVILNNNISQEKSNGLRNDSSQKTVITENVFQNSADLDTSKFKNITVDNEENKYSEGIISSNDSQENKSDNAFVNNNIHISNDINSLKSEIVTKNKSNNLNDQERKENRTDVNNEIGKNENNLQSKDSLIINDNMKLENVNCMHQATENAEMAHIPISVLEENEVSNENGCTNLKTISEDEHKKLLEHINLLNSEEFFYSNPLDTVETVNEICCDIFRKNPCKIVQNKFHELTHEINKWYVKFCTKEEAITCIICHITFEKIIVN